MESRGVTVKLVTLDVSRQQVILLDTHRSIRVGIDECVGVLSVA
jgi:hypothetical protein